MTVAHLPNWRQRIGLRMSSLGLALLLLLVGGRQAQGDSLEELASKYKIEVRTKGEPFPVRNLHGPIAGTDAAPKAIEKYTPWFVSEFGLYPLELIRKVELKRIVLCTDLAFAGQRRNAVPDFEHDTLYLEVVRGDYDPLYMRRVIHHDFFHVVDWKDDWKLTEDERWSALNAKTFRYGTGGATAQGDETAGVLLPELRGFLNRYSQSAVEEDKAEVFAIMVVQSEHIVDRARSDQVLDSKMKRMRDTIKVYCAAMDDSFWERARKLQRSVPADR